jgi:hypothetical protein
MKPTFRFRLNGVVMQEICVQRQVVDGRLTEKLELAVRDEDFGWFTVDDNEGLWDEHLPRFQLHVRNETEWLALDPILKHRSLTKGWKRMSPEEVISMLRDAGIIRAE